MIRAVIVFSVAALTLVYSNSDGTAQTSPERLRVSYSSAGITSIDLFLGRDLKYFQQQNLDAQLIRMPANLAIAAGISGEIDVLGSIGSAIRAIQRGAPLRVVSVTLRRPLFFLVARPEYTSVKDLKGKTMGIVTFGGSQHTTAKRLIALGGVNADKDLTAIQIGEEAQLLQALISGSIQVAAISAPYAQMGRDKFNLKILDSSTDKFASIQNGAAVNIKTLQERPEFLKRFLRARAKANQYFMDREKEASFWRASGTLIIRSRWKVTAAQSQHSPAPAFQPMTKSKNTLLSTPRFSAYRSRSRHRLFLILPYSAK